jgi:hypothetical protein
LQGVQDAQDAQVFFTRLTPYVHGKARKARSGFALLQFFASSFLHELRPHEFHIRTPCGSSSIKLRRATHCCTHKSHPIEKMFYFANRIFPEENAHFCPHRTSPALAPGQIASELFLQGRFPLN